MKPKNTSMKEFPLLDPGKGIPLFLPQVPNDGIKSAVQTLKTRWIGQGPKVDLFEKTFKKKFLYNKLSALAVGSGTDALHLAYLLAGIKINSRLIKDIK